LLDFQPCKITIFTIQFVSAMVRNIILTIFLLTPYFLTAQFSEDFSDGDFTRNPPWWGDTALFVVSENILRLNDTKAGSAFLSTPFNIINNVQWECWVRLAFTPSSVNYPGIYLTSDAEDLSQPLNGYYIRIGKDGAGNKKMFFYKQTGDTHSELMAGKTILASATNNIIRIKVTRDTHGLWEFFADPLGGKAFVHEGSFIDTEHTSVGWFGIRCFYSVSNAGKFYFDDFYAGNIITDRQAPSVLSVLPISSQTLEVVFDEALETSTATHAGNYYVEQGPGHPVTAQLVTAEKIILTFDQPFTSGTTYTLNVSGICDLSANCLTGSHHPFMRYVAQTNDIVINELMVNPTPLVGLPDCEYVELFNLSDFPMDLQGWMLGIGQSLRQLPQVKILPKEFLLLTSAACAEELPIFGSSVAVSGMSSTALINGGTTVVLYNPDMEVISFAAYTPSWYHHPAKAEGGWSLERIDPLNRCEGLSNWKASTDARGGTPGAENSVMASNPDHSSPLLLRAGFENPACISLFFNETLDETTLSVTENFHVSGGIGNPLQVILYPPTHLRVDLLLAKELQKGELYTVSLSPAITDCAGNALAEPTARVGYPEAADSFDIAINEILFNPPQGCVRYVEIYNRSKKVLDLKNLVVATMDTLENIILNVKPVCSESRLLFPAEYALLTSDAALVKKHFMAGPPGCFINTTLSSMTNTAGIVVIADKSHTIIDRVDYDEKMHYPLLATRKGVSLERISFHRPGNDPSNWHSAAATAGFGTPAYVNSQHALASQGSGKTFEIFPEVFSPDNDGHEDVLTISWKGLSPGFTANITIFDSRGRRVKLLSRSLLLAAEGAVSWDGTTDNSTRAQTGIYIIHIELYNMEGKVETIKKTGILAGKLQQ
jgi:hypothetical protein